MRYCWGLLCFLIVGQAWAQERSLSGKVLASDGTALPSAGVEIHELHRGMFTDTAGHFRFEGLPSGVYHLHVSFTGYRSETQTVDLRRNSDSVSFVLSPTDIEFSEIVIEADPYKTDHRKQSQTIESVDQRFVLKNIGNNLVSTLTKLPGINQINVGVGIAKPVIRGMSLNRISVVENGIRQEGQQWGTDHGLEIDAFNVNRVEIIKGPAAIAYGSDAIGGVIQLKPALPPQEGRLQGNLVTGFQSNNDNYQGSLLLETMQKGWLIRGRVSAQDYGDYRVPATKFTYNRWNLPIYNEQLKNTAGRERNASFTIGKYARWGHSTLTGTIFSQQAGIFAGAFGTPRVQMLLEDGKPRNMDLPIMETRHFKLISNSNILLGQNWLEVDLGFQRNIRYERATPHTHGFNRPFTSDVSLALFLNTFSVAARYNHSGPGKLSGIIGITANRQINARDGYEFFLPDFRSWNAGLFIYEKYAFGSRLYVNGGLRADFAEINISAYDQNVYAKSSGQYLRSERLVYPFSRSFRHGSFAVGASWFPHEKWNIKLNIANAFRFPNGSELGARGVHHGSFRWEQGDSSLNVEYGYQLDFNLTYESPIFHLKISPFWNGFENYLYLSPTARFSLRPDAGQIYQYFQTPAVFYGGEVSADFHPFKRWHLGVGGDVVINQNRLTELPLPFTPPASVRTELEYEVPTFIKKRCTDWYVSVEFRYTDSQLHVDRNELTTPDYALLNFRLGGKVRIFKGQEPLAFFIQMNNALDRKYFAHLSRYRVLNIPEPGRNVVLTLQIPFGTQIRSPKH